MITINKKYNKKIKSTKIKWKLCLLFLFIFFVYLFFNYINFSNHTTFSKDLLILVNKSFKIPSDYNVELVEYNGHKVNKEIVDDLDNMIQAAKKQNIILTINNAYRSIKEQEDILNRRIKTYQTRGLNKKESVSITLQEVQEPGYSEHHTGLAIDFSGGPTSNEEVWNWLNENAASFGFILRYSKDKQDITNITYEPWHYRYVGKEVSKRIKEENLSLEEYINQYHKK